MSGQLWLERRERSLRLFEEPKCDYTDTEIRITIDIDGADNEALSSQRSVAWHFHRQYSNSNMSDALAIFLGVKNRCE